MLQEVPGGRLILWIYRAIFIALDAGAVGVIALALILLTVAARTGTRMMP